LALEYKEEEKLKQKKERRKGKKIFSLLYVPVQERFTGGQKKKIEEVDTHVT
jgi:hypothetical protein